MIAAEEKEEICRLCREYRVRVLELFGSAAATDPARKPSDYDFLVEFEVLAPIEHADAYFGLLEALQSLLDSPVDLIERKAVTNPYFKESAERSKVQLYAAA